MVRCALIKYQRSTIDCQLSDELIPNPGIVPRKINDRVGCVATNNSRPGPKLNERRTIQFIKGVNTLRFALARIWYESVWRAVNIHYKDLIYVVN
jgi:hypothetical protein